MNRRMPNGTYGGVRGWGREAPAYSIPEFVGFRMNVHMAAEPFQDRESVHALPSMHSIDNFSS
jgi:hypothetical protein